MILLIFFAIDIVSYLRLAHATENCGPKSVHKLTG